MRKAIVALGLFAASATTALAQFSVNLNFDIPGAQIGVSVPSYPALQPIPGYPVYYAPGLRTNYFFYDGLYWVFNGVNWYASSWYNGPWSLVDPLDVPLYVLRVPVRYYRVPPPFFRGWVTSDAPHWGDHWGRNWESRRTGWDHWDKRSAPAPAPLPTYQRQYSGSRYPQQPAQQESLEARNYRYQPHDPVAQQHFRQSRPQAANTTNAQPQSHPQAQAQSQQQQQRPVQPQREARPQPQAQPQPQAKPQPQAQSSPIPRPAAPVTREQQVAREQQQAREHQQQQAREQQAHQQPQAARPQQQHPSPPTQAAREAPREVQHEAQHEAQQARQQPQPQQQRPQGNEHREQGREEHKENDNK